MLLEAIHEPQFSCSLSLNSKTGQFFELIIYSVSHTLPKTHTAQRYPLLAGLLWIPNAVELAKSISIYPFMT